MGSVMESAKAIPGATEKPCVTTTLEHIDAIRRTNSRELPSKTMVSSAIRSTKYVHTHAMERGIALAELVLFNQYTSK